MATYRSYDSATITGTLPANDEPRHTDEDGKSVVGAVDLRRDIDATLIKTADTAWREGDQAREKRNRFSGNNPHLNSPYSNLEALVMQSLRRYGDMHPGTVDGEGMMMFIEFANLVIEDLRGHPYWDNPEINYYTHPSEVMPIPDNIMVSGLLYHYAVQQQSNKIEAHGPTYFKMMNRVLYHRKYGSGKIEVSPWDRAQKPTGTQSYDMGR